MASIPALLNGVHVDLAPSVVGINLDQKIVDALNFCIKSDIALGYKLERIWVSSANDSHTWPSRHVMGKAVDISRINGKLMATSYNSEIAVTEIVNAIQDEFEKYAHRRENFGPHKKLKLGNPHSVGGHNDHIHFSVN